MRFVAVLARGARTRVVVAILVALLTAIAGWAQSLDEVHVAPSSPAAGGSVAAIEQRRNRSGQFSANVELVLVPTTVTDELNRPVLRLQQQDFTLFDNAKPQDIKYFHEEDGPISIGILLDTSGSMRRKYDMARVAVKEFFQNANREDDYFVITYSDKPRLLADTTQSAEAIETQLESVVPNGSTPLLDAIYLGLTKLRHSRYQRRALLIISDGGDNSSRYRAREIRDLVRESDVQIYALGLFSPLSLAWEDIAGKKLLNDITNATGGRAVFFSSPEKLPEVSASVSRELRSQYVLGYRPKTATRDGEVHRIMLKLARQSSKAALHMSYKREYFALAR